MFCFHIYLKLEQDFRLVYHPKTADTLVTHWEGLSEAIISYASAMNSLWKQHLGLPDVDVKALSSGRCHLLNLKIFLIEEMFSVFTESVLYNQWSTQYSQGYFPQIRMGLSGCTRT